MKHILKAKKRFLCLLLAGALAACLSPAALAAPDGVEVAPGYDYTRFKDAGITLNVYNWGEYLDPDVLDIFEEETGIQVVYEEYETNEIMYPKVQSGAISYDVVCPSDYMIQRMIENDLLAEINWDNIPNIKNIGQTYMDQSKAFDPENKYSVPYCWGTVGIRVSDRRRYTVWSIRWNRSEQSAARICIVFRMMAIRWNAWSNWRMERFLIFRKINGQQ